MDQRSTKSPILDLETMDLPVNRISIQRNIKQPDIINGSVKISATIRSYVPILERESAAYQY